MFPFLFMDNAIIHRSMNDSWFKYSECMRYAGMPMKKYNLRKSRGLEKLACIA